MGNTCTQQYDYPSAFVANGGQQVSFAENELVPLIGHAYAMYFTAVYGPENKWPTFAQQEYVQYATMPAGYTLISTFTDDDPGSNPPIGFWCMKESQYLVLVFRGTEGWFEWAEDALIVQEPLTISTLPNEQLGCVHLGFLTAFQNLNQSAAQALQSSPEAMALAESATVFITGHSLGAALATLASLDLHAWNTATYTFGCPRVGSPTFAAAFDKFVPNNYRVTSGWDIIPPLPPVMINPLSVSPSVYQHTAGECPVYTSLVEFIKHVEEDNDPFYGHHLSTYKRGLSSLYGYLNQSVTEPKPTSSRADAASRR